MNNISLKIENLLTRSFTGTLLSRLRSSNPELYKNIRTLYQRMFSLSGNSQLARYQARAILRFFEFYGADRNRGRLLEIGSDVNASVIKELVAKGFTEALGLNPAFSEEGKLDELRKSLPPGCRLEPWDVRNIDLPDNSVDAIFSVSVFEHLPQLDRCLDEMYRVLKPGGLLYSHFGPIWSSALGHHIHVNGKNGEMLRHWDPKLNPIDNYSHLLMDREILESHITSKFSKNITEMILHWIYDSDNINRLFFDDYINYFNNAKLTVQYIDHDIDFISDEVEYSLKKRYPASSRFDVRNIEVVLTK